MMRTRSNWNDAGQGAVAARGRLVAFLLAFLCVMLAPSPAEAQLNRTPIDVEGIGVEEKLGDRIPLDLPFIDSKGETVLLSKYFQPGRPVVMALVYYDCPIVCTVVVDHLLKSLNEIDYNAGEDFNVVVISFNTRETTRHAALKKAATLAGYKNGQSAAADRGWSFHTAAFSSVGRLATALGYGYRELPNGEFAHPTTLFVLTPDGRISRYIHGVNYPPRDLRLSLLEAAEGNLTRSLGDLATGFCFNWDPESGSYTLQAFRVMQLGGLVSVVGLVLFLTLMFLGERLRRRLRAGRGAASPSAALGPNHSAADAATTA